jgi:hypothetical protein
MGAMSERNLLDLERMNLETRFAGFLRALFTAKGYRVSREERPHLADLVMSIGDELTMVELKIHRSPQMALRSLPKGLAQLTRYMSAEGATRGILIITQRLSVTSDVLSSQITLWDVDELVRQTRGHPSLSAELLELLNALQVGAEPAEATPLRLGTQLADEASVEEPLAAGGAIISRLEAVGSGRAGAENFERECEAALKLMFGTEFFGWRRQNEVDEGFHRMDLIARLVPTENPFWATLASDFRTRYVIFEFKNYSDPITQDQIYTTEKYLFTAALRSVAIIIARNGAAASALKATRGALREHGKLILCLSLEDLRQMLFKLDGGGDPTESLYEQLDELLMTIAR